MDTTLMIQFPYFHHFFDRALPQIREHYWHYGNTINQMHSPSLHHYNMYMQCPKNYYWLTSEEDAYDAPRDPPVGERDPRDVAKLILPGFAIF